MAKYKLTPIALHRNDPAWQYSTVQGVVYVGATTEAEARELAAWYFVQGGKVVSGAAIPVGIPWLNADLTECVEVAELGPDHMPHGYVYAAE